MVTIDLITGFLGSGKTTFLKNYAGELMRQEKQICILENDFGAVNVDMMLLGELEGDLCELEMVAGGCDYDCHRRRFKTKLISMGMCGYDRVLVEPSGVYDVDEFFDVLQEDPLDRWYKIGSVITVVDAGLEKNLSEQAEYLMASQLSCTGLIVFSHCDLYPEEECDKVLAYLNNILAKYKCGRRFSAGNTIRKSFELWTEEDYTRVMQAGYHTEHLGKYFSEDGRDFESVYFMNTGKDEAELKKFTEMLFDHKEYGNIFRIKGFCKTASGEWMELNATKAQMTIMPIPAGQDVLIVIGENLDREAIEKSL